MNVALPPPPVPGPALGSVPRQTPRVVQQAPKAAQRKKQSSAEAVVIVVLVLLFALSAWAFVNPHANVPVVSKVVCSIKGASWTDGSAAWGIPAGCYRMDSP